MLITILNFGNYAAAFYQTLEEVPGPLLPAKYKNMEKYAKL